MPFPKPPPKTPSNPKLNGIVPPPRSPSTTSSAAPVAPSQSPNQTKGPQPLPPPKNKGGRPPGSKNKTKETPEEKTPLRELPKDPDALAKAIDSCRFPAQLVVSMGADRALKALRLTPLDKFEKDMGEEAWARYIYQHWGDIPPGIAILIWTGGILAPRVPEFLDRYFPKDPKKEMRDRVEAERKNLEAERAQETRKDPGLPKPAEVVTFPPPKLPIVEEAPKTA